MWGNKIISFQLTPDFPTQMKESGIKYFSGRIAEIENNRNIFWVEMAEIETQLKLSTWIFSIVIMNRKNSGWNVN